MSLSKKVKYDKTIVNVISICSLFFTNFIIWENIIQVINQKIIHPITITINIKIHSHTNQDENVHFDIISYIIRNSASAVQSLNKLSHSNMSESLLGAQTSLNKESTATGSVAEIIAQNNRNTWKGMFIQIALKTKYHNHHITSADISSHHIANHQIDLEFFVISVYFILYHDSNTNIGRNI